LRRREFISAFAGSAFAWPLTVRAQAQTFTVGIVSPAASDSTPVFMALRTRLKELGFIEGRSIRLDFYLAKGQRELIARLAEDAVRARPDVIVADGALIVRTLKQLTTAIPIVGILGPDPVASGLIASLARPDANITGVTTLGLDLHPKRAELLKEAVPRLARLGLLWDRDNDPGGLMLDAMEGYAKRAGLALEHMEGGGSDAVAASLSPARLGTVTPCWFRPAPRISPCAKRS
jgi:putative ABC transport system substrate-binding protein